MTSICALAIGLLLVATAARAEPIGASDIYIVDGDTIEVPGKRIRLVGFDAPELGSHAHCAIEQLLAARATSRLQQIIRIGKTIDLELVDCSWLAGTEGITRLYNYGRACGHLTVDGQDVRDTLIAENLAHPFVCGRYSCPKRQSWCPPKPTR
jgi:endonuclease YncB( thermonuclease family)